MRTTLASLMLAVATTSAVGHAGHGAPSLHGHGSEWLVVLAVAVIALLRWARRRR